MNMFRTLEWKSFFSDLFSIETTNDEILALHHHAIGSADGWGHNDYNLCSFVDEPFSNGINTWYYQCKYEDSIEGEQLNTKKVMRAITLIYYINNDCEGKFGGGTALYDTKDNVVTVVEPKNNRLMAFEVSPYSYHGFLSNTKFPRNSITQWFHQEPEMMFNRFNDPNYASW